MKSTHILSRCLLVVSIVVLIATITGGFLPGTRGFVASAWWILLAGSVGLASLGFLCGRRRRTPVDGGGVAFISYKREDLELAKVVERELSARGVQTKLIDGLLDVSTETELKAVLEGEVRAADSVVVVLTARSLKSPWVGFERNAGDTMLPTVVYVVDGLSILRALVCTHFMHKSASFKGFRAVSATRRYVKYKSRNAMDLVAKYVRLSAASGDGKLSLEKFALSFLSLDLLVANALIGFCENRYLRSGGATRWRVLRAGSAVVHATFAGSALLMVVALISLALVIFPMSLFIFVASHFE